MSRIGKQPVALPKGVEVKIANGLINVKGPKGSLCTPAADCLDYAVSAAEVVITRKDESRLARAQHGLRRTLLANCVTGVDKGFSKTLEILGVGYKVAVKGDTVELALGFSHPVLVELPKGIEAKAEGQKLILSGIDKEQVGEIAARIRRLRKPEPYKGKGIRYENEIVRRKVGKSGSKK
ncbi:50S ribosomal protein L6 [Desulfovibrio sp. OttesenSCG-928-M14]|nr:50S ribosomal protein L6 [Desulfovibrio sp. OttesenSCG-928-M16]MDL2216162.1 50S ribosomal protein L6 [Desulfovibrio sp. OttesenSCG-928-M14]MDL2290930.1 50S ribosomal protein L6 [Desulfovibrio sp. OttesenSCG-928-F20]